MQVTQIRPADVIPTPPGGSLRRLGDETHPPRSSHDTNVGERRIKGSARISHNGDNVDTTIRGLDEKLYRRAKARAAMEGIPVGRAVNEALRRWLASTGRRRTRTILELRPRSLGKGNERLSEEIDKVLYGA